ncbi:hypothetical protein NXC14_PA00520 (plasmid) [Rhizobium sp. NXC14]|uniref:sulfite exporter TauE/SafE family protein n=1 Tax=Rhizobium sp. NXC14 TaxID=1981173 RepID=UPI000A20AF41|nr:sulfite exporter TauE/SafE family protein [Rhizobium sp. NXC14]ARO32777.1 hypothetical protein NXC14_PA00520 [Rhizobium sp. NXC14]
MSDTANTSLSRHPAAAFSGGAIIGALGGLIGLGGAEFRLPILIVLVVGHAATAGQPLLTGAAQLVAGVIAGLIIGIVAALLGVAGGELLIPTLVLLFGAEVKVAGSLSLAVSLPTMLVSFTRYSRDQSFSVIGRNKTFMLVMAAGSIVGTFIGGLLLGIVPNAILLPALAIILLISAVKVWRTSRATL